MPGMKKAPIFGGPWILSYFPGRLDEMLVGRGHRALSSAGRSQPHAVADLNPFESEFRQNARQEQRVTLGEFEIDRVAAIAQRAFQNLNSLRRSRFGSNWTYALADLSHGLGLPRPSGTR